MSEDRRKILDMLAAGKLTADEAERLIDALDRPSPGSASIEPKPFPKFLRVMVDALDANEHTVVNVRVPLQLLRAGVKLASLIPPEAYSQVTEAMGAKGIKIDLSQLNAGNLNDLIEALSEMTVDVDAEAAKVRVFCE